MLSLSVIVTSHQDLGSAAPTTLFSPPSPDGQRKVYDAWETLSLLPFGSWKHDLHFTASFADTYEGMTSRDKAPMGFRLRADHVVRDSGKVNGG